jgi:uroporphyrinogen-III synthase
VKTVPSKPLSGVRILVGRARHQSDALSSELRTLGATVIQIPFIEICKPRSYRPLDAALETIAEYDWLILTSVNGVNALWGRVKKLKLSAKALKHLKIAAIGPATCQAIEDRGLKVSVIPKEYIAESVVQSLKKRVKGKRVLLARASVARDVIPRELRLLGAKVEVVDAYETVVPKSSRIRLRALLKAARLRPDIVTFTSSSTVRNFVELAGKSVLRANLRFASIGPVTSATIRELGLPVHVEARKYTIPGLVEAIMRAVVQANVTSVRHSRR